MNAIHDIPETNGSHSQHLDPALTSNFLWKSINFWPIWTRAKKPDGFIRHFHDHRNALKTRHFTIAFTVKYFFWKKCNSENMAKNVAAKFPLDLEFQSSNNFGKMAKTAISTWFCDSLPSCEVSGRRAATPPWIQSAELGPWVDSPGDRRSTDPRTLDREYSRLYSPTARSVQALVLLYRSRGACTPSVVRYLLWRRGHTYKLTYKARRRKGTDIWTPTADRNTKWGGTFVIQDAGRNWWCIKR